MSFQFPSSMNILKILLGVKVQRICFMFPCNSCKQCHYKLKLEKATDETQTLNVTSLNARFHRLWRRVVASIDLFFFIAIVFIFVPTDCGRHNSPVLFPTPRSHRFVFPSSKRKVFFSCWKIKKKYICQIK